jgi:hypothetical protein
MGAVLTRGRRWAEGRTNGLETDITKYKGAIGDNANAPKIDETTRSRVTKRRSSMLLCSYVRASQI